MCLISGATEPSTTPESPSEEDETQILPSSKGEMIQTFVQDCLDAHEEFFQSDSTLGMNNEHQPNCEHQEAEQQPGQALQREQLEKDDQEKSEMKPVTEEKEGFNPEQESFAGEMLETEKVEDDKQNEANLSELLEKKQPPLVRAAPPEVEEVVPAAHGPGPLVTELEEAEQLETIHLPPHAPRSLRIDDLPDLEDVDTEDFSGIFSSQRPKIEVISGGGNEDESEGTPTFGPDETSLFFMGGCNKSTGVSDTSSCLVYPEDGEPLIYEAVGKSKTNQTSSPPRCLIEELD